MYVASYVFVLSAFGYWWFSSQKFNL